ncbi:MAG: peptidoglycan bridge formation glycyltransferase FemA/FemB family protein [Phycisphaerae bacterium]|nr:peptidoglycan bridge formation glycyltransferase FemA/FemB family protein [Phycisphaerae bacterium]
MQTEILVDSVTPEQWRIWGSRFADYGLYQTWQYGVSRAAEMSAEVSRLVLLRGREPVGMAQVRIKRVPLTHAGVAHVLRGPVWRRPGSAPEQLREILDALRETYVARRGLTLRVIPNLYDFLADRTVLDALSDAGFAPDAFEPGERTIVLDLAPAIEDLRRGLAQKWRNCLNQSERQGLSVRCGSDDPMMADFERLYASMWSRKRFETGVEVGSFRAMLRTLPPSERPRILLATVDGRAVAGHVSSALGDTCVYLLGASDETGRRSKASYLLQWEAVRRAKERGARWYDLGGVDPDRNPGVYHFKAGLSGRECAMVGRFRVTPGRASTHVAALAERAYRVWALARARS